MSCLVLVISCYVMFVLLHHVPGVVEELFQLSKYPVMGEWKIHVTDAHEMSYFSSFKVEEFGE